MPIARSKADVLCLAICTLSGGNVLRGSTVQSIPSGAEGLKSQCALFGKFGRM